jgi:hypothetical protein
MNSVSSGTVFHNLRIDAAGLFACVVLTIAAYLAGALPLVHRHEQASARADEMAAGRQRHQELMACNHQLKSRLWTVEQAVAKADIMLQPARLINQRIAALTALANETGLEIQSINPGAPESGPSRVPMDRDSGPGAPGGQRFSQLPIRISGTVQSFQHGAAFLHNLRQTFHDMSVTGIDLADNPAEPRSAGASFTLQLVWYVLPAKG